MRRVHVGAGVLAGAGAAVMIAAFAAAGSDPPPTTATRPRTGLDVWLEQGCGSCHTFAPANATAQIGPDLQETLRGKAHDSVLESIVLPYKKSAARYPSDIMPDDYAQRIAPEDLEPLVEFLIDGARG
jgi:mono/diheme cytochrome c family protein